MLRLKARIIAVLDRLADKKSSEFEADLIIFHVFRLENAHFQNFSEMRLAAPLVTEEIEAEALRIAELRAQGNPLQHLLGYQFFFEHEYLVNDSTLVPRPETEILVSEIIAEIPKKWAAQEFNFAELGLGSGIISGEILARFKNSRGLASEANPNAIALARLNFERILGEDFDRRISILEPKDESTGFEIFLTAAPFDLIVSNPPYLSVKDELDEEVLKHEPHLALFPKVSGEAENPNYFYENFLRHASRLLKPDGIAFFEIPHERAQNLLDSFQKSHFKQAVLIPDLTGRARVLRAAF
jgi:release factor glutamine methyltransferase